MKTRNQYRISKVKEIEKICDVYPDLNESEKLFMVIDDLSRQAIQSEDHTKLASIGELAKHFAGVFVNPNTRIPTIEGWYVVYRLLTRIKKDKAHPHVRPYTFPYTEILADGSEVIRHYVDFLRGKKAVVQVNNKLERQRQSLRESQRSNNDLINIKSVTRELDRYREELEIKQQEANRKKRGNKR